MKKAITPKNLRLKKLVNELLIRTTGLQISRVKRQRVSPKYPNGLLYEADIEFNNLYQLASDKTKTPYNSAIRRARFYDLMQFFSSTWHLDGAMAECGCWKGLSSLMMCRLLQKRDSGFKGESYYIFDSFEGLSERSSADEIVDENVTIRDVIHNLDKSHFAASLDSVQQALNEFSDIEYSKGWLPQTLAIQAERPYRFVHVDVDIYEPTRGCIEYFFPRLVRGGILVCDDYGSLSWPGAKKAVDDYCALHQVRMISLSSGSAIMYKD